MLAAITAARGEGAVKIVVAVPVAARRTLAELKREVEEVACVEAPAVFESVGQWYEDFSQTSDQEVRNLLSRNRSSGLNVTQVLQ
jgi:putative phosphoribosyl transferase